MFNNNNNGNEMKNETAQLIVEGSPHSNTITVEELMPRCQTNGEVGKNCNCWARVGASPVYAHVWVQLGVQNCCCLVEQCLFQNVCCLGKGVLNCLFVCCPSVLSLSVLGVMG